MAGLQKLGSGALLLFAIAGALLTVTDGLLKEVLL